MKTSVKTFWDSLRTSYWFVPTLMMLGTIALWIVAFLADRKVEYEFGKIWWLYTGGAEGARSLLSSLIGAEITVAGVVFSITIVVLTLASQQFGPLLLRNFLRDKGSQIVLGMFVSTFIFCLLALRTVRESPDSFIPEVSVTTGVVLGIASIGVLVYFIHHISVFIQAPNLIDVVYQDLDQAIDRIFPEKLGKGASSESGEERLAKNTSRFDSGLAGAVKASDRGYIKAVDSGTLLKTAVEHDIVVRLVSYPGDFVIYQTDIVLVLPQEAVNDELTTKINESFIFGARRTATQDLDFLFSQLVEIAVRALSPGINDPFTAVIVIDHLCAALSKLAGRALPSPYRRDEKGDLRVIAFPATFVRMVDTGFGPIRYYGKTHPQVLSRMLWSISMIARFIRRAEDRDALTRHAESIIKSATQAIGEDDRQEVMDNYREAMKALVPAA